MTTASNSDDDEEPKLEGLVEEDAETPTAARGKRNMSTPKRSYAQSDASDEGNEIEDDYVPMAKRVKAEPTEDDGLMFASSAVQFNASHDEIEV